LDARIFEVEGFTLKVIHHRTDRTIRYRSIEDCLPSGEIERIRL
jgi:hypothetical protein